MFTVNETDNAPIGFKKTNVGIIPTDWEIKRLKDIGHSIIGLTYSPKDVTNEGGTLVLRSSNIQDGKLSFDNNVYVKKEIPEKLIVKKGDILVCARNGSKGLIGKNALIKEDNKHTFGAFMSVFRTPFHDYLYQLFQTDMYKKQIKANLGATINQITTKDINNFKFPFPSSTVEQQMISSILSTWDKAIELKGKLIDQKKEHKKGLMQTLLSGEVRLSGFDGEWNVLRIKDIGTLKGGSGFPEKYQNETNGKYPFYKVSDMNNKGNEKYMLYANNYINEDIRSEIKATIVPKNSIVFAKVGAALLLERKRLLNFDSCIDNNMMALTVKEGIDYNFVYYFLLNMKLSRFSNVGALPSLNAKDVYSLKCRMPVDYQEQTAIAEILTYMDKEIDLLQSELIQIELQKQGLMQLLLTGKIRVNV